MVWFDMARLWSWVMAVSKFLFNLSKITNLKVWFPGVWEELWNSLQEAAGNYFFSSDQFRSQTSHTKPYHTKPRHFKPIFRPFWPIFWAKVPKSKWIWFEDAYPLNQWIVLSWKILGSHFDQFEKHHFCSADMCQGEAMSCLSSLRLSRGSKETPTRSQVLPSRRPRCQDVMCPCVRHLIQLRVMTWELLRRGTSRGNSKKEASKQASKHASKHASKQACKQASMQASN